MPNFGNSLKKPLLGNSKGKVYTLPTSTSKKGPFQKLRANASDAISNISDTVSSYNPINNVPEDDGPWYRLSQVEKVMAFGLCLLLGVVCFTLSFFFLPLFPGKFAATFTLGSILILVSVALLRGPKAHLKHMASKKRLPFTLSYVSSMVLTLYAALAIRVTLLTILFAIVQIIALIWYVGSYVPGGISALRQGTAYIGRNAASILPV